VTFIHNIGSTQSLIIF